MEKPKNPNLQRFQINYIVMSGEYGKNHFYDFWYIADHDEDDLIGWQNKRDEIIHTVLTAQVPDDVVNDEQSVQLYISNIQTWRLDTHGKTNERIHPVNRLLPRFALAEGDNPECPTKSLEIALEAYVLSAAAWRYRAEIFTRDMLLWLAENLESLTENQAVTLYPAFARL